MIYSNKVMLVPIKEMTDVLSVESKSVELAKDSWVRVKTGIYKGDLGKVCDPVLFSGKTQFYLICWIMKSFNSHPVISGG